MALDLHFTSAAKGILPGTSGFCTVAVTSGMTTPMIQKLESLSGYRPIYQVGGPEESKNPVSHAHWRVDIGGRFYSIVSRVSSAGVDYTRRSNKYAHHVVVEMAEQVAGGPAWVMMQPGVLQNAWSGEPRALEPRKLNLASGTNPPRICDAWARVTGDAGWAGVLADSFLRDGSKPVYILFEPGLDLLPLIDEAIALLPEATRWKVTFNTFFSELPAGLTCSWRCCVAGTPAAQQAPSRATSGVLVDLTKTVGLAPDSRYVLAARTGQRVPEERRVVIAAAPRSDDTARPSVSLAAIGHRDPAPMLDLVEEHVSALPSSRGMTGRASHGRSRTGSRRLLWIVAIGWPILVLGLAAAIFRPWGGSASVSLPTDSNAGQLTTQGATARIDADQNSDNQLVNSNKDLNRKLDEARDQITLLNEQFAQAQTMASELRTRVTQMEKERDEARRLLQAATQQRTSVGTPVAEPGVASLVKTGAATQPGEPERSGPDASIGKQPGDSARASDPAEPAAKVRWPDKGGRSFVFAPLPRNRNAPSAEIRPPRMRIALGVRSPVGISMECPEGSPLAATKTTDALELWYQPKDAFGNTPERILAGVVQVDQDAVWWQWKPTNKISARTADDIAKFMESSWLTLTDRTDASSVRVFLRAEPQKEKVRIKADGKLNPRPPAMKRFSAEVDLPPGWIALSAIPSHSISIQVVGRTDAELVRVSLVGDPASPKDTDQIQARVCSLADIQNELLNPHILRNGNRRQVENWIEDAKKDLKANTVFQSQQPPPPLLFRFLLASGAVDRPVAILEIEK